MDPIDKQGKIVELDEDAEHDNSLGSGRSRDGREGSGIVEGADRERKHGLSMQTLSSAERQSQVHELLQVDHEKHQQMLSRGMGRTGKLSASKKNNNPSQLDVLQSDMTGETGYGFHSRESLLASQHHYNHPNQSMFFSRTSLQKKMT